MAWKAIHRWLGLTLGALAVVLGLSGAVLAIDPVQQAWEAPADPGDMPVATLVERVAHTVPGVEEIQRLPSGSIVAFSFAGDKPQASYVDPADGRVLGAWHPSALPRWVKNLHRSLLLGDAGRWGAAAAALTMGLLCVSAWVLLLRRMGGLASAGGARTWLAGAAYSRDYRAHRACHSLPLLPHSTHHERLDAGAGCTGYPGGARGAVVGHRSARHAWGTAGGAAKHSGQRFAQAEHAVCHRPAGHVEGGHHPRAGLDRPVLRPNADLAGGHLGAAGVRPSAAAAHRGNGVALGGHPGLGGCQCAVVLVVRHRHMVASTPPGTPHQGQCPAGPGRCAHLCCQ